MKQQTQSEDFDLDSALSRGERFIEVLRKTPPRELPEDLEEDV